MKVNTRVLAGLFVASAGDIGSGLIIIKLFGYSLNFTNLQLFLLSAIPFMFGVLLSMLPDFDILLSREKLDLNLSGKHRQVSHWPLITIPVVAGITLFITNSFWWMIISALCFVIHYADDVFDKSGVMLFAPISLDHYEVGLNGIKISTQEEIRSDPPPPLGEWIDTRLLKPTPEAIGRLLLFTIGILVVLFP